MRSKLHGTPIALYTAVATLDGSGGASVAAWVDADGAAPLDAFLLWTNNGADPVTVGDSGGGIPAQVLADTVVAGFLFGGREVTIDPGESIWCELPRHLAALGDAWAISAPLSSVSAVSVTVAAYRVDLSPRGFYLDDNITRNAAGLPTSARRRFFPTAALRDAATPGGALTGTELATTTVSWTYDGLLVETQVGVS